MKKISWLKREAKFLQTMIPPNERVLAVVRQHKLDFSPLYPAVIIATEHHLLVCNRWFMGLKNDISFIPYSSISSYRLVNGILFSGIMLRMHGSSNDKEYILQTKKEEGEIKGLEEKDAMLLINAISTCMRLYADSSKHNGMFSKHGEQGFTITSGMEEGQAMGFRGMDNVVATEKPKEAIGKSTYMVEPIFG